MATVANRPPRFRIRLRLRNSALMEPKHGNGTHRDDIVARIFEDMLSGLLKREEVPSRIKNYVAEFNRLYPTKYAKFGDCALLSLDEVLFDYGTTTRGDNVSRGLWD